MSATAAIPAPMQCVTHTLQASKRQAKARRRHLSETPKWAQISYRWGVSIDRQKFLFHCWHSNHAAIPVAAFYGHFHGCVGAFVFCPCGTEISAASAFINDAGIDFRNFGLENL
jgi:hypothetical protein